MQLDDRWYELYTLLYGNTFNRILTLGNKKNGYINHNIRSLDQLQQEIDKHYPHKEFYISLYDYKTDTNLLKWDKIEKDKFEKYSIKDRIVLRFRDDTTIIQQETAELNEIQTYMFIRRSINLGQDKKMLKEVKTVYEAIENLFQIKALPVYNGYNEYCLYIFLDEEMQLENPSITLYYFYKFIEDYCDTKLLKYEKIEPFSQIITIPGTQNNSSRLYSKVFNIEDSYPDIIENASRKELLNDYKVYKDQRSPSLTTLLETMDKEITKRLSDHTDVKSFNLNELFHENRIS